MKRLILLPMLFIMSVSYSQEDSLQVTVDSLEQEANKYSKEGWKQLTIGFFAHAVGAIALVSGPLKSDHGIQMMFGFNNGIGLTFDTLAIISFSKARKIRKKLESIDG